MLRETQELAERLEREQRRQTQIAALLAEREGVERRLAGVESRLGEVGRDKEKVGPLSEQRNYLRGRLKAIDASLAHEGFTHAGDVA